MKISQNRRSGFTLVEIMIVVAIIGLLAAIAIPNFVKARTTSQLNTCIANLKQLNGAKANWAMHERHNNSETPVLTDLIGTDRFIRTMPVCPSGGDPYINTIGQVDANPTCSLGASDGHSLP